MVEYIGQILTFLAAIVAIKGDTFHPEEVGMKKVALTGWIAGCIAIIGLIVSFQIIGKNDAERLEVITKLGSSEEREEKLKEIAESLRGNVKSLESNLSKATGSLSAARDQLQVADKKIDELNLLITQNNKEFLDLSAAPRITLEPWAIRYSEDLVDLRGEADIEEQEGKRVYENYENLQAIATLHNSGGQISDLKITNRTLYQVEIRNAYDCPNLTFRNATRLYPNPDFNAYPAARSVEINSEGVYPSEDLHSFDVLDLYRKARRLETEIFMSGDFRDGCIDVQPVSIIVISMKSYYGAKIDWYGKYNYEHYAPIDIRPDRDKSFDANEWENISTYIETISQNLRTLSLSELVLSDMGV